MVDWKNVSETLVKVSTYLTYMVLSKDIVRLREDLSRLDVIYANLSKLYDAVADKISKDERELFNSLLDDLHNLGISMEEHVSAIESTLIYFREE